MNKIITFLERIFGLIIYLLSWLFPRSKEIWIFGAWFGQNYSDNSKYLFEYVNEKDSRIKPIWITKSKSIVNYVSSLGYRAYLANSICGIYYSLRAKIGFVSSGFEDLNKYLLGNVDVIQLWHGIPLKKIMYDDFINLKREKPKLVKFFLPFNYKKYKMLIATSEEVQLKLSKAFKVKRDLVKITGFPRNDSFFNKEVLFPLKGQVEKLKMNDKKIGIYLPTFRDSNRNQFINRIIEDFNKLDKKLINKNCFIYVKLHFIDQRNFEKKKLQFNNIKIIRDVEINADIYSFLPYTDFLITDYSSIFFDYLLLKKPILFYAFDYLEYTECSRGLYYDYNSITPGAKFNNIDELFSGINQVLLNSYKYDKEREEKLKIFHTSDKGNYCEKLVGQINYLYKMK